MFHWFIRGQSPKDWLKNTQQDHVPFKIKYRDFPYGFSQHFIKIHQNNRRNSPIQAIFPRNQSCSFRRCSSASRRCCSATRAASRRAASNEGKRERRLLGGEKNVKNLWQKNIFQQGKLDLNHQNCGLQPATLWFHLTDKNEICWCKNWDWSGEQQEKGNLQDETMYFKNQKNLGSPSTQWRSNHANSSKLWVEPLNKLLFWSILISLQIETLDIVTECGLLILLVY